MSMINGFIVAAALAASTVAAARPAPLSDTQYMAAARCRALIASPALGKQDTTAIDGMLKAQGAGRMAFVQDRADAMQADAEREARHAGAEHRSTLIAERDGACRVYAANAEGSGSSAGR